MCLYVNVWWSIECFPGCGNNSCKGSEHILGTAWRPMCLSTGKGRQGSQRSHADLQAMGRPRKFLGVLGESIKGIEQGNDVICLNLKC